MPAHEPRPHPGGLLLVSKKCMQSITRSCRMLGPMDGASIGLIRRGVAARCDCRAVQHVAVIRPLNVSVDQQYLRIGYQYLSVFVREISDVLSFARYVHT